MSYQVLARKWRPRNFEQMVGQEHVLRALINALDNNRLHHAFLFTGTRGVGKTTIGRILAKSLNCEEGISSKPCGVCSACTEIDEGRFIDLIEVDAASRTKVEDTRELLENVQYAPSRGRFKVYLIDEVHMLSNHSFNALLKTLEEPPPHVKFLLATTDPQKLPVTILSRCLQFNLKRLPIKMITEHLASIMGKESIDFEPAAIAAIARAADGSMRDALSLLDQAIAHGGGKVTDVEVRDMLGTIEQHHVVDLLRAVSSGDAQALLDEIDHLSEHAPDFTVVLSEMLSTLHRIALAQVLPDAVDETLGDQQEILELAGVMLPEDVQLYYQIGLNGQRDLPLSMDPRSGFEMIMLRMLAFRPVSVTPGNRPAGTSVNTNKPTAPVASKVAPAREALKKALAENTVAGTSVTSTNEPAVAEVSEPVPSVSPGTSPAQAQGDDEWLQIVTDLGLKAAARELAVNCSLISRTKEVVQLALDPMYEQICTKSASARLEQALQSYLGSDLRLDIRIEAPKLETPAQIRARQSKERQADAVESIKQDPLVQELQDVFNADLDAALIQPNDSI